VGTKSRRVKISAIDVASVTEPFTFMRPPQLQISGLIPRDLNNPNAFVPHPLPPHPALEVDQEMKALLKDAENSLQKLDMATQLVLSQEWLLYGFVRKEALVSSQLAG
jgi:hypothetical protein